MLKHENVSNAKDCQERFCQKDDKCTAFMYKTDTEECYLKRPPKRFLGIVQLNDEKNSVFGPKFCPGIIMSFDHNESKGKNRSIHS